MQVLYFAIGFAIAAILVLLMGCEQGKTPHGRDCIGFAGMTIEGEQCEQEPPMCCMALIPSCMACADNCTIQEWLTKTCGEGATDAEYAGWDTEKNEPIWLCQMTIIN